ncbi:MAG: TM2 domain-containing protein [Bacteroidetes bacterium]|uniref:TM2 domain-containing protein n=1 Tax=Candidatus Cryptobacteroides avistercoris TaxID=2840758 RepID=A0A9D9IXN7_9BACT|nr:TM2 domain-containing protein [Candidatus Cryptobacteroides avistercoris]
MAMNKKFFTNQQLMSISETLSGLDEENYQNLVLVDYKDPTVSLILSIFVGTLGVDRFYIGKIGAGVGKLLTFGGLGVWWLIDIFCIQDATKDVNYEEFNEFLALLQR